MLRLPDSMTVAQLRDLEEANPQEPQYIHRMTSRSYDEFVRTLYVELNAIVKDLEDEANHLQKHGENALNSDVCRQLRRLGYGAVHDKNNRGHADITVQYATYTWIGEGKRVESVNNGHLAGGYDQLLERYVTGKAEENQAAMLVYCFAPSAKHVMSKWREHLAECNKSKPGYAESIAPCTDQPEHSFWSQCLDHKSSGSTVTIKHVGFSLHWAPSKS